RGGRNAEDRKGRVGYGVRRRPFWTPIGRQRETFRTSRVRKSLRYLVGLPGFEPGTSCTPSKRASQAAPQPEPYKFSIRRHARDTIEIWKKTGIAIVIPADRRFPACPSWLLKRTARISVSPARSANPKLKKDSAREKPKVRIASHPCYGSCDGPNQ